MIIKAKYTPYDEAFEIISVDLSDKKHKNRVINFLEERNPITHEIDYRIIAQWSPLNHPVMTMKADEIIELAEALNEWVDKIKASR